MKKKKTYLDRLMGDKEFREKFDQEYRNLCIAEQIAQARYHVNTKRIVSKIPNLPPHR